MEPSTQKTNHFDCLGDVKNLLKPQMHIYIDNNQWIEASNFAARHPEKVDVSYFFQDTVELLLEKNSQQSLSFLTTLIQAGKITQLKPSYYSYAFNKGSLQYLIANHSNFIADKVASELIQKMQNNPQSHYAEARALLQVQNGQFSLGQLIVDNFDFFSQKVTPSLVDPNLIIDPQGNTLLFLAAKLDRLDIVQRLRNLQANFLHQNNNGETVYHIAMQFKSKKVITHLIQLAPTQFTQQRDQTGKTALQYLDLVGIYSAGYEAGYARGKDDGSVGYSD